jgi:hypothetical protein
VHPLVMAIPRFIQIGIPLPSLKPMAQSRRGAHRVMKAQVHPLEPLSEGAPVPSSPDVPPQSEAPHAVIDPSALRAAKAYPFE